MKRSAVANEVMVRRGSGPRRRTREETPMRGRWLLVGVVAACALLALGCAGNLGKQVMSNPEMQAKIMQMIASSPETAGTMADRLMASDSTRVMVIDRLLANPSAAHAIMDAVAKDRTMVEGVLNQAMQDPAMRDHVITLFKGMQMAGAK
jgi:tellurite resistance protein